MNPYESFAASLTAKQWARIGIRRHAGVAVPLFSLYSKKSLGIGELPDLELLVDWCKATGLSIIQLLPMNDTGFNFTPYDAQSAFALDPMYLSLTRLRNADGKSFASEIETLRFKFPVGKRRVNYGIKGEKLGLLWKIYQKSIAKAGAAFREYCEKNKSWLRDYAFFKVIKTLELERGWAEWPTGLRNKDAQILARFEKEHSEEIRFQSWLQWQLFCQFSEVNEYARSKGVFLMGDIPFLVSRDSADVWAHQDYFRLDLSAGAPPDMYFAQGQRWGMPPYHWQRMEENNFDWFIGKLRYAENFYDLFRIDHVVGIFRLWTIQLSEPSETAGLNGTFDPKDESLWEGQGRKLISLMVNNTQMLPCAEDLGVVPKCSYAVLEEFGIPGMDVQRWAKDWGKTHEFKKPEEYRKNSVGVVSTHDMMPLCAWWEYEAGTVDEVLFHRKCREKNLDFETIKPRLFDPARSFHGRLRWKEEIRNLDVLLGVLARPRSDVWELADLYLGSYGEKQLFWNYVGLKSVEFSEKVTTDLIRATLRTVSQAASVFNIQLLQDWLSLGGLCRDNPLEYRINFPGLMDPKNWSVVLPVSLEELKTMKGNVEIQTIASAEPVLAVSKGGCAL